MNDFSRIVGKSDRFDRTIANTLVAVRTVVFIQVEDFLHAGNASCRAQLTGLTQYTTAPDH